ncbi:28S ribosomal protein S22, mitochondrial isoform X2 [Electrophorus electricus]|uniref:28S ribosomal protein S22, mitochondrial isoform X2 n=1 Tax=Electrophorus electricus TaxID=8005 RepID=UPI0015CFAF12|nr:28S ribosomal protein S22, mitochondrial isoform X2 [Electrophorus electricus]
MAALRVARGLFRSCRGVQSVDYDARALFLGARRPVCTSSSDDSCEGADGVRKAQFADAEVQEILTRITGLDLERVFKPIKRELKPPKYKLMTDAQLEEAVLRAREQAGKLLKMPLVVPERQPIDDVLAEDTILEGMDTAKHVFTDITFSTPHRERFIVVREPSGMLRKATWEERDRLIQVYFPKEGRKLTAPPIFNEENLKVMFRQDRHEEVLNHCLVQFEPDSADFKKVHTLAFEHLEQEAKYEVLRSTRFFGPLVWYLVTRRRVDGLLTDMLQRDRLQDALSLVRLFNLVHPQSDCALQAVQQQATGLDLLKIFADCESQKSGFIKLALQTYEHSGTDIVLTAPQSKPGISAQHLQTTHGELGIPDYRSF